MKPDPARALPKLLPALIFLAASFAALLWAVLSYLKAAEKARRPAAWPAVCLFALALLAKGTLVSLPLVLLVLDVFQAEPPGAAWDGTFTATSK